MLKRVLFATAAALAMIAVGTPVWALTGSPAQINDIYALTLDGKIYRIVQGNSTPILELTLPTVIGEWIDFDPSSGEFLVGPDTSMAAAYRRVPMSLTNTGTAIPGTSQIGGNGGSVDRNDGNSFTPSDFFVVDAAPFSAPDQIDVLRVKGDNSSPVVAVDIDATIIDPSHPSWRYSQPEDVEENWANGDLYVAVDRTDNLPAAVLRFNKNGGYLGKWNMPDNVNPRGLVFDNRDALPTYELIVASSETTNNKIYAIDVDQPAGTPMTFLRNAPAANSGCDDLAISPSGKLIYPSFTEGKVYQIDLTPPYNSTLLANLPNVRSIAFVSRNKLASLDSGASVGQFSPQTGPTGKPGVKVVVTDPEFSSGLKLISVSGANLVVYDGGVARSLPYYFYLDERREITSFSFISEKINASSGASIHVEAHDSAGICGDPPAEIMVSTKGSGGTVSLDLEEVPPVQTSRRVVQIFNDGIDKITLEIGGESYKLNGDKKMSSGQTLDLVGKNGTIKIPQNGSVTLLVKMGDELDVTVAGNGQSVGNDALITVN